MQSPTSAPHSSTPVADLPPSDLRPAFRHSVPVRGLLGRLLPDPMRSIEEYARYVHADLAGLSVQQRARELRQLQVAVALTPDLDRVPRWALVRLQLLQGAP